MARFHCRKIIIHLLFAMVCLVPLNILILQKRTTSDGDIIAFNRIVERMKGHDSRPRMPSSVDLGKGISVPDGNHTVTAMVQRTNNSETGIAELDQSSLFYDVYRWRESMIRDINETIDQETFRFGHVEANRRLRMNRDIDYIAVQNGNIYVPYRDVIVANGLYDKRPIHLRNSMGVTENNPGRREELVGLRLSEHARRLPENAINYSRDNLPEVLSYIEPEVFRIIPPSHHFFPGRKNPCFNKIDTRSRAIQCLPYVYLGGAPKSATTDVWTRLRAHPDVIVRPSVRKEPHFWTRGRHTNTSVEDYLRLLAVLPQKTDGIDGSLAGWKKRMIGVDASADTLFDNLRVARSLGNPPEGPPILLTDVLRAVQPDAKFIFILRNPAERLYSDFLYIDYIWELVGDKTPGGFHRRVANVMRIFDHCLRNNTLRHCVARSYAPRISVGMYSVHLREWFHRFPRDQILILRTERWATNMTHEYERIREFLDLSPISDREIERIVSFQRSRVRSSEDQPMLQKTKSLLDEFFEPYNKDLVELLGDEGFSWSEEHES